MTRLTAALRESVLILIAGVVIALLITGMIRYTNHPTLEDFKRDYSMGTFAEQVATAETYLGWFSAGELNSAIEEQNADGVCHSQAHALGRAVYKTNPNFSDAIRQCGNACTFGCFHGVLMRMFSTDSDTLGGVIEEESPEEYLAHVKDIARDLCTKPEVQSVVRERDCYHGVGHVIGYANGTDLKKSITDCDMFTNQHAATSCRSGVFMEYLLGASSTPLQNTKGKAPCDAYPQFTNSCYRFKAYGWVNAWGNIHAALRACDTFGSTMMLCISNIAESQSSPKRVSTVEGIESMCGELKGEKHAVCVDGALRKVIDLNNGDDSERVCDVVAASYRAQCLQLRERISDEMYYTM